MPMTVDKFEVLEHGSSTPRPLCGTMHLRQPSSLNSLIQLQRNLVSSKPPAEPCARTRRPHASSMKSASLPWRSECLSSSSIRAAGPKAISRVLRPCNKRYPHAKIPRLRQQANHEPDKPLLETMDTAHRLLVAVHHLPDPGRIWFRKKCRKRTSRHATISSKRIWRRGRRRRPGPSRCSTTACPSCRTTTNAQRGHVGKLYRRLAMCACPGAD